MNLADTHLLSSRNSRRSCYSFHASALELEKLIKLNLFFITNECFANCSRSSRLFKRLCLHAERFWNLSQAIDGVASINTTQAFAHKCFSCTLMPVWAMLSFTVRLINFQWNFSSLRGCELIWTNMQFDSDINTDERGIVGQIESAIKLSVNFFSQVYYIIHYESYRAMLIGKSLSFC